MDSGRILRVSGPGTLRVFGGDARSDEGASIALYAQEVKSKSKVESPVYRMECSL